MTFLISPATTAVERYDGDLWRIRTGEAPEAVDTVLEAIELDKANWRISDPTRDESDASRLLGYIECLASGRYEVFWLAVPRGWAYVESWEFAMLAVADRERFEGVVSDRRDPSAASAPPTVFHRSYRRFQGAGK